MKNEECRNYVFRSLVQEQLADAWSGRQSAKVPSGVLFTLPWSWQYSPMWPSLPRQSNIASLWPVRLAMEDRGRYARGMGPDLHDETKFIQFHQNLWWNVLSNVYTLHLCENEGQPSASQEKTSGVRKKYVKVLKLNELGPLQTIFLLLTNKQLWCIWRCG